MFMEIGDYMIKLVVLDMDGTLLQSNYELSDNSKKAIALLKEKNIKVAIATGRPTELLKEYISELDLDGYHITCNGSVIYNQKEDSYLHFDVLDSALVEYVVEYAKENHVDILLFGKGYILSNNNERYQFFTSRNQLLAEHDRSNLILMDEYKMDIEGKDFNKILLVEPNKDKYNTIVNSLKRFDTIEITQSKKAFIDIGPRYTSKGNAVQILSEYYNIDVQDVLAIGDQYNDISMFAVAGIGVAMGNATDDVKQYADEVAKSNDEDGVYYKIIEKI